MRHLQEVRASDPIEKVGFRFVFDVAGEDSGQFSRLHAQNDRAVVLRGAAEVSCGDLCGHHHGAGPAPIAVAHEMNVDVTLECRGEQVLRAHAAELARRDP